jgi:hypothetical protein
MSWGTPPHLVTQGSQPHPGSLDLKIVELHLAAALFGAGLEVGKAQRTLSANHREEVEMTALCLRILQASVVFVNTLMLQDVLAGPDMDDRRAKAYTVRSTLGCPIVT